MTVIERRCFTPTQPSPVEGEGFKGGVTFVCVPSPRAGEGQGGGAAGRKTRPRRLRAEA